MLSCVTKRTVFCTRIRQIVPLCSYKKVEVKYRGTCDSHEWKYSNLTSPNFTIHRFFNTSPRCQCNEAELPPLMRLPSISPLSPFNVFFSYWILRYTVDKRFDLEEFLRGAKQAMISVSSILAEQDFKSLDGLMKPRTITVLTRRVEQLTPQQRELIPLVSSQFMYIPGNIKLRKYKVSTEKVVEITVFGVCIKHDEDKSSMLQCIYVFERRYVDGVGGQWIIKLASHFT